MPDRIALHDGLLDSDAYNALDPDARDLYVPAPPADDSRVLRRTGRSPPGLPARVPGAAEQLHAQSMVMFYMNAGRRWPAMPAGAEALRFNRVSRPHELITSGPRAAREVGTERHPVKAREAATTSAHADRN
jgi:hypothetical protein